MSSASFSAGQKRPATGLAPESRPSKLRRVGLSRKHAIFIEDDDDLRISMGNSVNVRGGATQRVAIVIEDDNLDERQNSRCRRRCNRARRIGRWVNQVPEDARGEDVASVVEVDPLDVDDVAVGEDLTGEDDIVAPAQIDDVAVNEIDAAGWAEHFGAHRDAVYFYNGVADDFDAHGVRGEQQAGGFYHNGNAYDLQAQQENDYHHHGAAYDVHGQGVNEIGYAIQDLQRQQEMFPNLASHFVEENRFGGLPLLDDFPDHDLQYHGLPPVNLDLAAIPQQLPGFPLDFPLMEGDDDDVMFGDDEGFAAFEEGFLAGFQAAGAVDQGAAVMMAAAGHAGRPPYPGFGHGVANDVGEAAAAAEEQEDDDSGNSDAPKDEPDDAAGADGSESSEEDSEEEQESSVHDSDEEDANDSNDSIPSSDDDGDEAAAPQTAGASLTHGQGYVYIPMDEQQHARAFFEPELLSSGRVYPEVSVVEQQHARMLNELDDEEGDADDEEEEQSEDDEVDEEMYEADIDEGENDEEESDEQSDEEDSEASSPFLGPGQAYPYVGRVEQQMAYMLYNLRSDEEDEGDEHSEDENEESSSSSSSSSSSPSDSDMSDDNDDSGAGSNIVVASGGNDIAGGSGSDNISEDSGSDNSVGGYGGDNTAPGSGGNNNEAADPFQAISATGRAWMRIADRYAREARVLTGQDSE